MKDRIKEVRRALRLTQAEFGEKVGVKGNTIGNYEIGLRSPSEAVIFSICREFDVNEDWLRTGQGEMFRQLSRSEIISDFMVDLLKEEDDSFRRRLIEALADLDINEWKSLEKIATKVVMQKKKD